MYNLVCVSVLLHTAFEAEYRRYLPPSNGDEDMAYQNEAALEVPV